MNVVVVVEGGLVETLQALPLLGSLRVAGHGPLVLAAPPAAAELAGYIPDADEVLALPALDGAGGRTPSAALLLRRRRVDAVVLCSTRPRDRALAYVAGVARRIGPGGGALDGLLTARVAPILGENRAAAWLRLAESLGAGTSPPGLLLDPGDLARQRAESLLVGRGFEDGRPLVAIAAAHNPPQHQLAGPAASLRWDPERFAHLANQLGRRHGAGVVLLGEAADRPTVDRLLLDLDAPRLDLCGELTLIETAAVLERCDLAIAGDSAVLHLAAMMRTPTVGLYGPTDGRVRGPLGSEHLVIQALADGDGTGAMARIRVDDVLATVEAAGVGAP